MLLRLNSMAAVRVPTVNNPPPNPIPALPTARRGADESGAARITAAKAKTPARVPMAAIRQGSPPRPRIRAESAKAKMAPPAVMAVSMEVLPTPMAMTCPP